MRRALPVVAAEAALLLAQMPFGPVAFRGLFSIAFGLVGAGERFLPRTASAASLPLRMLKSEGAAAAGAAIPAASRMASSSPVPTTASTSGMLFRISSR